MSKLFGEVVDFADGSHYISVPVTLDTKDLEGTLKTFSEIKSACEIRVGAETLSYDDFRQRYLNNSIGVYISHISAEQFARRFL